MQRKISTFPDKLSNLNQVRAKYIFETNTLF